MSLLSWYPPCRAFSQVLCTPQMLSSVRTAGRAIQGRGGPAEKSLCCRMSKEQKLSGAALQG